MADESALSPFEHAFAARRRATDALEGETHIAPLRLGFLLSGSGRTLENLAKILEQEDSAGAATAEICCVISDRKNAFGLTRAKRLGIPHYVHPCRNSSDAEAIFARLEEHHVELGLLGGFLRLLTIPPHWLQRVLNIHPSLIPKYCGDGFYGDRVHQAVLEAGETESGCTVHFVDNIYDNGPALLQERVAVQSVDTVESLAQRVFDAECRAFPRAVRLIAGGAVSWHGAAPRIDVERAKQLGVTSTAVSRFMETHNPKGQQ